MTRGYNKLFREWAESPMALGDPIATHLFMHLLCAVRWTPITNGRFGYTVNRGEIDLSIDQLERLTGLSSKQVRSGLQKLVKYETIEVVRQKQRAPSIIRLINYEKYQGVAPEDGQANGHPSGQANGHSEGHPSGQANGQTRGRLEGTSFNQEKKVKKEKSARAREEQPPCQTNAPVGLEKDFPPPPNPEAQAEEFLADLPIWENRGPTGFVRTLFTRRLTPAERAAVLAWKPILAEAVRLGDPANVRFLPALRTMLNPNPDAENGRWWESMDRVALRKRLNPDGVSPARQAGVPAATTPLGLPEWAKWWDGLSEQERRKVLAGHLGIPTVCKRVDAAVVKSGAMLASGGELRYGDGLVVADLYATQAGEAGRAA